MSTEVLLNVEEADDGGYVATAPSHDIVRPIPSMSCMPRFAMRWRVISMRRASSSSSDCTSFETRFSLREA